MCTKVKALVDTGAELEIARVGMEKFALEVRKLQAPLRVVYGGEGKSELVESEAYIKFFLEGKYFSEWFLLAKLNQRISLVLGASFFKKNPATILMHTGELHFAEQKQHGDTVPEKAIQPDAQTVKKENIALVSREEMARAIREEDVQCVVLTIRPRREEWKEEGDITEEERQRSGSRSQSKQNKDTSHTHRERTGFQRAIES
eukprot:m.307633 g.307633  ORF g.307633 m.307633 type:complete len:203 (-) comp23025_c1_seq2:1953-2561(-)